MKLTVTHIIASVCLALLCSALLLGADFMNWDGNFSPIVLANITTLGAVPSGNSPITLLTSGNAEISADNSTTAQLSYGTDTLFTEYKLEYDGDGAAATGGSTVDWTTYNSFLTPAPSAVTHVADDNDVVVTLHVRASNYPSQLANAGEYTATQTLTVHWVGP